ncbi:MAG: ComEC family competence protein [Alphaproteobacteria bacterium ADurb.Bin438]|nr:MAG: ComEC family competence protein [Alphaproteobacteria bacterium ADurb.Bin438]
MDLGFIYSHMITINKKHEMLDADMSFSEVMGVVDEVDYYKGSKSVILKEVRINNKSINPYLKLTIRGQGLIKYGDYIKGKFNLYKPSLPSSYYDNSNNISLWFDNIYASGFNMSKVEVVEYETKKDIKYYIYKARDYVKTIIKENLNSKEYKIAFAFVVGEKGLISEKIKKSYQNSGIAHILSVSGMHISLVAFFIFFVVRSVLALIPIIALRYDIKKISAIISLVFASLYLMISGMALPVIRAYIMVFVSLIAILFDRKAISLRNISIAAFIILLLRPDSILSPSFQMSFMAVFAIVALAQNNITKITLRLKNKGIIYKIFVFLIGVLITDFVALVTTSPITMYHFNKVPLLSVFGNLAVAPIFSFIIMPCLFLGVVFGIIGFGKVFFVIAGFGIKIINEWAELIDGFDMVYFNKAMPSWGLVLCVLSFVFFIVFKNKKLKSIMVVAYIFGFVSPYFTKIPNLMINDDGSLIAINHDGKLWFNNLNKNKSLAKRWALKVGNNPDKIFGKKKEYKEFFDNICDKEACIYEDFVIMKDKNGCLPSKVLIDLSWFGCDLKSDIKLNRKDLFINGTYSFFKDSKGKITYKTSKDKITY